jgi:hypothetical protein
MIPTTIYKYLAMAAVVFVLILGAGYKGYQMGSEHEKVAYATAQVKANAEVAKKNEETQVIADKTGETQVVYRDKIVTKYKTITKEIIKYEQTPAASVGLDSEFVRLHNNAARAHDAIQITKAASGPDGETPIIGVTTGEAIGVITRNYESYYQCRRQVIGWVEFYTDLQKKVNE